MCSKVCYVLWGVFYTLNVCWYVALGCDVLLKSVSVLVWKRIRGTDHKHTVSVKSITSCVASLILWLTKHHRNFKKTFIRISSANFTEIALHATRFVNLTSTPYDMIHHWIQYITFRLSFIDMWWILHRTLVTLNSKMMMILLVYLQVVRSLHP